MNYVTFHTDVKNDEWTSENLVVSYLKNKDIEDDFAIHHFLLESVTIDKLLYGADGDTVDIEIDDSYYTASP